MPQARLLDVVRGRIRVKHYSYRTETSYLGWIRRFIRFHNGRHPRDMGGPEVEQFLSYLATERSVAASTQNQALSAILFLYREALEIDLPWLDGVVRAKRRARLPVGLSRNEVRRVLAQLEGTHWLAASLLYGAGLRVSECLRLRVKDLDFDYRRITVRDGKGAKDRCTMLPDSVIEPLHWQLKRVRRGSRRRPSRRGSAARLGAQVPRCAIRVALAVPVSCPELLPQSILRPHGPIPRPAGCPAAGGEACRACSRHREAGLVSYLPALVRHTPAGVRLLHPHGAVTARPFRRVDHDDLHARAPARRPRRAQPAGLTVRRGRTPDRATARRPS